MGMLARLLRIGLRYVLCFCALVYPFLSLVLLSADGRSLWPSLGIAAVWSLTCSTWLYRFCREEWLKLPMSFYHAVTLAVAALGVLWVGVAFLQGDDGYGLHVLGVTLCTVLPYLLQYAFGKWKDSLGMVPTGAPPVGIAAALYVPIVGLPFLFTAVRLLSEWIYRDIPHMAMEYYRHTPPEVYRGQMVAFEILLWLCLPLCLLAGWLCSRKPVKQQKESPQK